MARAQPKSKPRIMVHIVAYNAASTLTKVLDRIPDSLRPDLTEVCVFDDASKDDTFLVGQGYKLVRNMPSLQVFRNPVNRRSARAVTAGASTVSLRPRAVGAGCPRQRTAVEYGSLWT